MRALGTYRRAQHIEEFERLVKSDQRAEVLKASAWALGEYFGEKEATRKGIVGNLIQAYSAVAPRPGGGGKLLNNADLSMEVRHDFQWALARLTGGTHFDRAREWADWWRSAKDSPLPDGLDRPNVKLDNLEGGAAPGSKSGGH